MKRIINNAPSLTVATLRTPLTATLTLKADAGTLTQTMDEIKSVWSPSRRINPLILRPIFSVYDADQDRSLALTPTIRWYKNAVQDYDPTTGDGEITSLAPSSSYYKETANGDGTGSLTGRLVVRADVHYLTPVELICVATYTDNTRQQTYDEEQRVLLTTENSPDDIYLVELQTEPVVNYRPLKDSTSVRVITAKAQLGGQSLSWQSVVGLAVGAVDLGTLEWSYASSVFSASLPSGAKSGGAAVAAGYTQNQSLSSNKTLSTSGGTLRVKDSSYGTVSAFKSAISGTILFYELAEKTLDIDFAEAMERLTTFFWYANGVLIPTDGQYPGYVGGQGTESLTLDLDYIDGDTISVMLGTPVFADNGDGTRTVSLPTSPNAPTTDVVLVSWLWGHLDALPIGLGGSKVRERSGDKPFVAVVREDGVDVDASKVAEYVRLNWKSHATDANYSAVQDHGWGVRCVVPSSRLKQTGSVNVEVSPEIYTLGKLEIVTDDSGNSQVTDDVTGEPVIGRT